MSALKIGDRVKVIETRNPFHYLKWGTEATVSSVSNGHTIMVEGLCMTTGAIIPQSLFPTEYEKIKKL